MIFQLCVKDIVLSECETLRSTVLLSIPRASVKRFDRSTTGILILDHENTLIFGNTHFIGLFY